MDLGLRVAVPRPRPIVQGATVSVCRRTAFRKAFFAPWHPMVRELWLYSLADAARASGAAVHMATLMPTHLHTDVTPREANLPTFTNVLHSSLGKGIRKLLELDGFDVPRDIFDGRQPHHLYLLDAGAQISQFIYDYVNPTAAGLVTHPSHMPGQVIDFGLWGSEGLVIPRPSILDRRRPSELLLRLEPSPRVMEAFDGDIETAIYHHRKLARVAIREVRAVHGRPALGAEKLKRLNPYDEPRSSPEPRGGRVPTYRLGASGMVRRKVAETVRLELQSFAEGHEKSRQARRAGDLSAPFPYGTYAMRVSHDAPLDAPLDGAILIKPGPLFGGSSDLSSDEERERLRVQLLSEVSDAFGAEASDIAEDEQMHFASPRDRQRPTDEDEQRPDPVVQNLSQPRGYAKVQPRRVVIRRRRRRQRRRNSDPPRD